MFATGDGRARVFLAGGEFDGDNGETTGPTAMEQLRTFHADPALLGVAAIDSDPGAMDISFEEAQVALAMIANVDSITVLADSPRFEHCAAFSVCALARIDHFVSEREPHGMLAGALADAGVTVRWWRSRPATRDASLKTPRHSGERGMR